MKITPRWLRFSIFLTWFLVLACSAPEKRKGLPEGKLIKTIGNPRYGNVQCILQDKAGNLWFGTTQNGLYRSDGKSFTQFLMADGLNSNSVYSLLESKDGKIWIGTEAGLCLYDPVISPGGGGQTFASVPIPLPANLPPNNNPNYRNSHWVYSMLQAKTGEIWLATIDGVYVYNGRSFTPFPIEQAERGFLTGNDKVERILEDKAGNIWLGGRTNKGVYRYDGKSITRLKLEQLIQDGPRPKAHEWGWPQVQDRHGNIWFSNWGGVYRYDGRNFTGFTKKDGLADNMVARVVEDRKGNIWFGGGGLSRYDGKSFARFTTRDGLPDLGVWDILEDRDGYLWVGTRETGLYVYDGKKFISYSEYRNQAP